MSEDELNIRTAYGNEHRGYQSEKGQRLFDGSFEEAVNEGIIDDTWYSGPRGQRRKPYETIWHLPRQKGEVPEIDPFC